MGLILSTLALTATLLLVFSSASKLKVRGLFASLGLPVVWLYLSAGYFDLNGSHSSYATVSGLTVANLVAFFGYQWLIKSEYFG